MPIYEYKCQDCGHVTEVFVRKKGEEVTCEKCGSTNLNKLISKTNVKYNCGGFYRTGG